MKRTRGLCCRVLAGLGLAALAGCQTYWNGCTLPSPRYLEHPPSYAPDSPYYPFARELASQQAQTAAAEAATGAAAGGLPARVPAAGGQ